MLSRVDAKIISIAKLINSAGVDAQLLRHAQNRSVRRRREAAAPRPRSYVICCREVVVATPYMYGDRRPR